MSFAELFMTSSFFSQAPRPQLPIEGPWRQASLKSFIKNVDAGKPETGTVSFVAEKKLRQMTIIHILCSHIIVNKY